MGIVTLVILGVLAIVVVGLALRGVGAYNKLVALLERTRNAFAQIDVQLERRYDLIPNLVEVAKGYMDHEKDTLESVMQARASATQARVHVGGDPTNTAAMAELGQAEGMLTGALGRLMAVAENYPDLKANQNMMQLTEELTTTENKVAFARQGYNDQVNQYRAYKGSLIMPLLISKIAGFEDTAYLEIEEAAKREAPKVSFD
jgi:LemA protein